MSSLRYASLLGIFVPSAAATARCSGARHALDLASRARHGRGGAAAAARGCNKKLRATRLGPNVEVSGGLKRAKRALGCPLDWQVRLQSHSKPRCNPRGRDVAARSGHWLFTHVFLHIAAHENAG